QFRRDLDLMNGTVDDVVRRRRAEGVEKDDLLGHMLSGVDPQSGQGLDDLNIRYQILTFLIAGHETTSGLLSFALSFLLKTPAVLARAYAEVDAVLGEPGAPPTHAQLQRLVYVGRVLKETLRLWPTAPAFTVTPREATKLAGRYEVKPGVPII